MTVETFFANFGHLADAPNGVQTLRELILQLAVQGKLVSQDPNDEPASVLLGKIRAEKERMVKDGRLKKSMPLPKIGEEEIPFVCSISHLFVRLLDVCLVVTDGDHQPPPKTESGVPFLVIGNVRSGQINFTGSRFVSSKYFNNLDPIRVPSKNDILYTVVGSYGIPVAVTTDDDFCVQRHIAIIKPSTLIDTDYLRYSLSSKSAFEQATACATGIAQKTVPLSGLRKILVPLPPLKEQKRIVAKVDQLMALCDELEDHQQKQQQGRVRLNNSAIDALLTARQPDEFADHWQRISTNFDLLYDHPETITKLRAAILQLAVQGKLVPQDPNDEPASVLLERVEAEKEEPSKKKRGRRSKELAPINSSEVPFDVPKGWEWARYGHVARIASNLVKPEDYQDAVHVAPDNIEKGNGKLLPCRSVKEDKVRSNKHLFFPGQIIYSKIRPNLSKATIVDFGGLCSADMYPVDAHLVPGFLLKYMLSETFLSMAVKKDTRVAMPKINQEELNNILVPVPPVEEQKRIVAKADQLMALCDELEAKLNQAQQHSEKLMEATVRQLLVA